MMSSTRIESKSKASVHSRPSFRTSNPIATTYKTRLQQKPHTVRFVYSTEVLKAVERLQTQLSALGLPQAGQLPGVLDYTTDILIYRLLEICDSMARANKVEASSVAKRPSADRKSIPSDGRFREKTHSVPNISEKNVVRRKWQTGLNLLKNHGNWTSRDSSGQRESLPRYSDPIGNEGVIMALNKMNKLVRRQRLVQQPIPETG